MPTDTKPVPYTSPWWLDRLGAELDKRDRSSERYERYYNGDHPFPLSGRKFREAFRDIFAGFSDNYCRLVVQALEERMTVDGFRFGSKKGDAQSWGIWQDNQMDMQSQRLHREALIKGEALCMVGWDPADSQRPIIRVHEPEHLVTGTADDPLTPVVAMKRWESEADGRLLATLYYADRLEKYQQVLDRIGHAQPGEWEPRLVGGEDWPLPNPIGMVPVVAFPNDADMEGEGHSELAGIVPLQNAVNKTVIDMLTASEFAAFPQRYATGLELTEDPETGRPIEPYKAAVDRIWVAASSDVKFGDFAVSDLSPYVKACEMFIQHIASVSRTPAHYLLGSSGVFPSGEALRAVETGLVAKARRRHRDYGEGWEQVMRLALRVAGNVPASRYASAETVWKDPETRTESEHVDAVLKKAAAGVPRPQLWEDLGYSPQQIAAWTAAGLALPDGSAPAQAPDPAPMTAEAAAVPGMSGTAAA